MIRPSDLLNGALLSVFALGACIAESPPAVVEPLPPAERSDEPAAVEPTLTAAPRPEDRTASVAATGQDRPESSGATGEESVKLGETWYDVKLAGKKLGFAQSIDERVKVQGHEVYHLYRRETLTIKRLGPTLRIEATTDGWVDVDGSPRRFDHRRMEGSEPRSVEGHREGEEFVVRKTIGANVVVDRIPITDELRLASSLELLLAKRLKVGFRMKGQAIVESQGDVVPYTIAVIRTNGDGHFEVNQQLGPIKATMWMNKDGTVVRSVLPELRMEQVKVTEREAKLPSEVVDLFSQALLRLPRPLPARQNIEQLVVRIESKGGNEVDAVGDDRQTVRKIGRAAELTIRVQRPPRKSVRRPIKAPRWQPFLQSTEYEPLDHPGLRSTAERLTTNEETIWGAARAINAFVYRHIKDKTLARAYMSAPEALASQEGDCTEHSVLFSSLAKISGIPTRLVTGLVYVGGPENVLGYHEWVEVWTGEEWLAMDPTFGQEIADATHIKLHAGLSDPKGLRASGQAAGRALADFDFKVVAYVDGSGKRHPL